MRVRVRKGPDAQRERGRENGKTGREEDLADRSEREVVEVKAAPRERGTQGY